MPEIACQGCDPPYNWLPIEIDEPGDYADEQMGTKEKFWMQDQKWLFKQVRTDEQGARGEDWAECLVHVVARRLEMPSQCVALARCRGKRGVLVKSIVDTGASLVLGNQVLANAVRGYQSDVGTRNPGYTLDNVRLALNGFTAATHHEEWLAFDLFAGYLMMDALVAGGDRHHGNWAVFQGGPHADELAPSFDHGNALGFAESVQNVKKLVEDPQALNRWVERGCSKHFADRPRLVDLAAEAMRLASPQSVSYFIDRLRGLSLSDVADAAAAIPEEIMSEPHRRFVIKIIERNRERLTDAIRARGLSA